MSDNRIKISELEETTQLVGTSYIPVDDGTYTKRITVDNYNASSNQTAKAYAEQAAADAATITANIATSAAQIREAKLAAQDAEDYKDLANGYKVDAQNYATSAQNYAGNASSSATSAINAALTAGASETAATAKATLAESYAVGGTNTRTGEDTDNAKYYKEQSAISETNAGASETAAVNARDRAEAAATSAESWSAHPPYVGENGHWYAWDIDDNQFEDTGLTADITVVSTQKTSTVGLVDTYRVTMSDGSYFEYSVTNGRDGSGSVSSVNNVQPIGGNVTLTPSDIGAMANVTGTQGKVIGFDSNNAPEAITPTASLVGLGNVPNVATNDQTPTYTEASTLTDLTSGEVLSTAFGKIKKAIADLISHIGNTSNPHSVTKSQVGLGNCDNTSDANKPVSTAQQNAINAQGGIWSSTASCVTGDTTATITNSNIATTSTIEAYSQNTSGTPIPVTSYTVTTGQVVLGFAALTEATSFKVKIYN